MASAILMEVRPRLHSCNVCIRTIPSPSDTSVHVRLTQNTIVVDDVVYNVGKLTFEPNTISKLHSHKNYINFNVHINNIENKKPRFKWFMKPPVLQGVPVTLECCCGWVFKKDLKFLRVLPLPSSGWNSTEAFCHGGKQLQTQFRSNDFLYSTHFFQVSCDIIDFPQDGKCPKCSESLGEKQKEFIKLWTSNLKIQGKNAPMEQVTAIIRDVTNNPLSPLVKILFESESGCFLCIFILDKELAVFKWNKNDKKLNLSEETVMKVEYTFHDSKVDKVLEWSNDPNVNIVLVSDYLLEFTKKILNESFLKLPPGFKFTENGPLAYLPYC